MVPKMRSAHDRNRLARFASFSIYLQLAVMIRTLPAARFRISCALVSASSLIAVYGIAAPRWFRRCARRTTGTGWIDVPLSAFPLQMAVMIWALPSARTLDRVRLGIRIGFNRIGNILLLCVMIRVIVVVLIMAIVMGLIRVF
jgi:hypothetical protein